MKIILSLGMFYLLVASAAFADLNNNQAQTGSIEWQQQMRQQSEQNIREQQQIYQQQQQIDLQRQQLEDAQKLKQQMEGDFRYR